MVGRTASPSLRSVTGEESVFANYMRDPERDGFSQPDIPQDVQAELLACATHKHIDFYWLCAIYRMALQAGLASAPPVALDQEQMPKS